MNHWIPEPPPAAKGARAVRPFGQDPHHANPESQQMLKAPQSRKIDVYYENRRIAKRDERQAVLNQLRTTRPIRYTTTELGLMFHVSRPTMDGNLREMERQKLVDHKLVGHSYRVFHYGATASIESVQ